MNKPVAYLGGGGSLRLEPIVKFPIQLKHFYEYEYC
jgi:hypothetical protein